MASQKFPKSANINWICAPLKDIQNISADYAISAGLLDWVSDADFEKFLQQNKLNYHVHSFSLKTSSAAQILHRLFSWAISHKDSIAYTPRSFEEEQVKNLFSSKTEIVTAPQLSFGAFIHNLPGKVNSKFQDFKTFLYFRKKQQKQTFIEPIFKSLEKKKIMQALPNLTQKRVLEIGSGAGVYTRLLLAQTPLTLSAIDPYVETGDFVSSKNFIFQKINIENYESPIQFDVILALGVLEFTDNPELFLNQLKKFLAPGAQILILAPREKSLAYGFYKTFHRLKGKALTPDLTLKIDQFAASLAGKVVLSKKSGGFLNNLFIIRVNE